MLLQALQNNSSPVIWLQHLSKFDVEEVKMDVLDWKKFQMELFILVCQKSFTGDLSQVHNSIVGNFIGSILLWDIEQSRFCDFANFKEIGMVLVMHIYEQLQNHPDSLVQNDILLSVLYSICEITKQPIPQQLKSLFEKWTSDNHCILYPSLYHRLYQLSTLPKAE